MSNWLYLPPLTSYLIFGSAMKKIKKSALKIKALKSLQKFLKYSRSFFRRLDDLETKDDDLYYFFHGNKFLIFWENVQILESEKKFKKTPFEISSGTSKKWPAMEHGPTLMKFDDKSILVIKTTFKAVFKELKQKESF